MGDTYRERPGKSADHREVICRHCGASIRASAAACPECGSDERTGWSDDTYLDGISLPDDDNYDDIYEREFGEPNIPRRAWRFPSWKTLIGIIVIAVLCVLLLRSGC